MVQRCSSHLKSVLKRWATFWVRTTQSFDGVDVIVRIARHVTNADGDSISHAEDTKLRDRILLEELADEADRIIDGEQMSRRS